MTHPTQIKKSQTQAQIPKGYKWTKLGVIPKEWEESTLGEIGKIRMCKRVFNHETSEEGDIPFFKIGTFGKSPDAFITNSLFEEYKKKYSFPKKGDILVSAAGTIGRTVIYNGEPSYFQDSNIVWIDNHEEKVLNVFLFFVYEIVKYDSEGGTIQRLYNNIISSARFSLPPLPEQRVIAACLGTWDRAIEKLDLLIKLKEQRKKGLMQQLLTGKKRLPGFSGEWEEKQLGKYFKERSEKGHTDLSLLSIGELGVYPQDESNKKDTSNQDKSLYKKICVGDIGYNTMRMWQGRSALSSLEGIVSPAYTIVAPRANADAKFFSYLFKLQSTIHKFYRNSQGLVRDTRNWKYKDFAIVKVDLPPTIEEQKAIATVLTTADKEIKLLQTQLDQLRDQKKGMMQQLLTGKKRLKID